MIGLYRFSRFSLRFFMVLEAQDPASKPDQAVGPESTVVSTCLQPIRIMLYGTISDHMEFHVEISAFMWHSCIMELALGPFGPQTSLNSRFYSWELLCRLRPPFSKPTWGQFKLIIQANLRPI